MKQFSLPRCGMMLISMLPMSFGVTLFLLSGFGNDPFSSMTLAVAAFFKAMLGPTQLCVNLVLFVLVLMLERKMFGVGTVVNMVVIGYMVDFFNKAWLERWSAPHALLPRVLLLAGGVVVLSLGAALYFTASLGVAPYDATAFVLSARTPLAYAPARMLTDLVCVATCLLFGGRVGVGTLVSALCLGPFIAFFRAHASEPMLASFARVSAEVQP